MFRCQPERWSGYGTQEDQGEPSAARATFGDWESAGGRVGLLHSGGATTSTSAGSLRCRSTATSSSLGHIAGIEGSSNDGSPVQVTGTRSRGPLLGLRTTPRTRSFVRRSDAQVIEQVASEHGLLAQVDLRAPTYDVVVQLEQSDLSFLRERARFVNADLWIDDRALSVKAWPRDGGGHAICLSERSPLAVHGVRRPHRSTVEHHGDRLRSCGPESGRSCRRPPL